MSNLTEKIAAEHPYDPISEWCDTCEEPAEWSPYGKHIATVTEAAAREQIAADLATLSETTWDAYKNGTGIERADPYTEGQSDAYDTAATLARGDS